MMSNTISASAFSYVLRNMDEHQTDGKHTGEDFRKTHLPHLDSQEWWDSDEFITLDFKNVIAVGPSWVKGALSYFLKFKDVTPEKMKKKIKLINISEIKRETIEIEIETSHKSFSA